MKNVTIVLEEEVARWARIRAAELDTSLSRFLGEILRERMTAELEYESAMGRYLARGADDIRQPGESYPDRQRLHER